jgi:ATP-dependent helicase/nuclease subunit A
VRVVTVHGAKGLEAPIVILADAGPRGQPRPGRLLWGAAEPDGPELPFWRAAKQDREGLTERLATEAELREQEERQRLLYVALTRARDRLYVTGWQSRRHADGDPDPTSWHDLVRQALDQLPGVERFMSGLGRGFDGQGWRLRRGITTAERTSAPPAAEPTPASLPAWALTEVADEPPPLRPMAPSRLAEPAERLLASPGSQLALGQRQRGLLLHRLLQLLPNVPAGERAAAGARLLAALAPDLGQVERAELLTAAIDVLDAPELAALFGPGSRAEQSLAGVVAGHAVMGAVDRMLVTADSVLIVDYKSGRPPMSPPVAYLRQLAAYRSLLQAIYPGRAVRAALLWTEVPVLDELPAILLDSHAPGAGLTLPNGHPYCVE